MENLEDILGGGGPGAGGLDDTEAPMYVPVTVTFNGYTWNHVGMRYKGNSSLHSAYRSGVRKYARFVSILISLKTGSQRYITNGFMDSKK